MKKIIFILLLVLSQTGRAQNLVPNPSFEDTVPNPVWSGAIILDCLYWNLYPVSSPDHYHNLNPNFPGAADYYHIPHDGEAYAAIYTYYDTILNSREYVQVQLIDTLEAGKKYKVSFWVIRSKLCQYAIGTIGAYFFNTPQPIFGNWAGTVPQINNNPALNPISDTVGWKEISGTFIADGTETFIGIGNFNPDSTCGAFYAGGTQQGWIASYYYIDDISVTPVNDTIIPPPPPTEPTYPEIKLYPIPSYNGVLSLEYTLPNGGEMVVHDALGQIVGRVSLESGANLKTLSFITLASGVYHYRILADGLEQKAGKLVISK